MGIVAHCPNGHRIKVKDDLAGKKGICPTCSARFRIPRKETPDQSSPRDVVTRPGADGLPTARVVSLDPLFAASLPTAHAIDEAGVVAAAAPVVELEPADAQPDFVLVADGSADDESSMHASDFAEDMPVAAEAVPAHAALDERPDLAWCVALRGGAPSEPLTADALRAWLEGGEATAAHVVWRTDWPEWRPLGDVFPEALPPPHRGWP